LCKRRARAIGLCKRRARAMGARQVRAMRRADHAGSTVSEQNYAAKSGGSQGEGDGRCSAARVHRSAGGASRGHTEAT